MSAPIVVASFWQETNTYSPRTTTLADFEAFELLVGDAVGEAHVGVRSVVGGALAHLGARARFALAAGAWPAGPASEEVMRHLLDRLAHSLAPHRGSAGVVLNLHGAMVAEGYPDVELEAVRIIKRELGDVPVVAVLDFHANPSREFLAHCDAAVAYTTYPHVDMFERGRQAAEIVDRIVRRQQRADVVVRKLPLLTSPLGQGTDLPHMKDLVAAQTTSAGLLGAFVTPGFPYSDVGRAGLSVMVNRWQGDADAIGTADALASRALLRRDEFRPEALSIPDAIRRAVAAPGRVMLADVGDNIGGGSPGEGTALLRALLDVHDKQSLVIIADPQAADIAHRAGAGAEIDVRLGGHIDQLHGSSVPVRATVRSLSDGRYVPQGEYMGGRLFELGPCAVLRSGAVTVIVTSISTPPFHIEQVTCQGLDVTDFDILTAKGALAWQDPYGPFIDEVVFVDTPGVTPAFPEVLPRTTAPDDADTAWEFPAAGTSSAFRSR